MSNTWIPLADMWEYPETLVIHDESFFPLGWGCGAASVFFNHEDGQVDLTTAGVDDPEACQRHRKREVLRIDAHDIHTILAALPEIEGHIVESGQLVRCTECDLGDAADPNADFPAGGPWAIEESADIEFTPARLGLTARTPEL